jgi:hypothetical protein
MSRARGFGASGARGEDHGGPAATKLASWLGLVAAPTFALMAALTSVPGRAAMPMLCSSGSLLGGMTPMYALMTAFHLAPWLRLVCRRRGGDPQSDRSADQSGRPTRSYL